MSPHLSAHPGEDTILKSSCILYPASHPAGGGKWIQITLFKILSQFVRSLSHPVIRVQYVCFFLQYVNKSENKRNFPGMGRWVMAARISTLRQFLPRIQGYIALVPIYTFSTQLQFRSRYWDIEVSQTQIGSCYVLSSLSLQLHADILDLNKNNWAWWGGICMVRSCEELSQKQNIWNGCERFFRGSLSKISDVAVLGMAYCLSSK